MTRYSDRVVMESGRAWWERISRRQSDPFDLDGYGRVAEAGGDALLARITDDVAGKLELTSGAALLEVGCGAGAIVKGLAPRAGRLIGADFSLGMLQHARSLEAPRTAFVAGDGSRLPFRSGSFDRVLCYSVFNNFSSLEFAARVALELMRVARPGGLVMIGQVPNIDRKDDWLREYVARFGGRSRSTLRSRLGDAKQTTLRALWTVAALWGKRPPASLQFLYYPVSFFEQLVAGTSHRCEILPAFNLLQQPGGPATYDIRVDIRIRLASDATHGRRAAE